MTAPFSRVQQKMNEVKGSIVWTGTSWGDCWRRAVMVETWCA